MKVAVAILLFMASLQPGEGRSWWMLPHRVRCMACKEVFDLWATCKARDSTPVSCPGSCIKLVGGGLGMRWAKRFCSPVELPEGCSRKEEHGMVGEICICNSDLCNTALAISPPATMIGFSLLLVVLARGLLV